jgi:small conductance mechanosensitive channel
MAGQPDVEIEKRVHTLTGALSWTAFVVVLAAVLFISLPEFGINAGPLIAGAGVAGIAIGFGAQTLVKDGINGFFILAENQFARGDVVNIAGIGGLVEDVNLRRTIVRDLDGAVHTVPNSAIVVASNLTRAKSAINMNVSVTYGQDLDRVMDIINAIGRELAEDATFGPMIIEPPKVLRVEDFTETGVVLKILGQTQPIRQWDVMGEMRLRIKKAFDREGIEFPSPYRMMFPQPQASTKQAT